MINKIIITNFALIDRLEIDFQDGLNIISGETGAGKTILIEALNMILGDRADAELVRTGHDEAIIEGIFTNANPKKNKDKPNEGKTTVTRNIYRNGKNKCQINKKNKTLAKIQEFSEAMVDLHGQHVHQSLLNTLSHLDYLDRYGGKKITILVEQFTRHYEKYTNLIETHKKLTGNLEDTTKQQELLRFQIAEIENANLDEKEEDSLREEKEKLANIESIKRSVLAAYENISGGEESEISARNLVGRALDNLSSSTGELKEVEEISKTVESMHYQLEEISIKLRNFLDTLESNPQRLDDIEARLAEIDMLKRKYGKSIVEIIEFKKNAQNELDEISSGEKDPKEIEKEISLEGEKLIDLGQKLSKSREVSAEKFEKDVIAQLKDLNMEEARFKVEVLQQVHHEGLMVDKRKLRLFKNGFDRVEFLISTNPGEPIKPLKRVASGGELSRVMLALKIVLANVDNISSMIFDEIDSGIGGKTASRVGQKLAELAQNNQVICITHLPQIACFAGNHLLVEKVKKDERTITNIKTLSEKNRVSEIARMLAGEGRSFVSREHAEQMIERAQKIKEKINN